jgi:hypothetical protein
MKNTVCFVGDSGQKVAICSEENDNFVVKIYTKVFELIETHIFNNEDEAETFAFAYINGKEKK